MTARLRLTLLYGALFLGAGALLLTVTYLLVAHAPWPGQPDPPDGPTVDLPGEAPEIGVPEPIPPGLSDALDDERDAQRDEDLRQLLRGSVVALAGMTVVSTTLGWVVAGRVLRPIATMTATTRRISADSLHVRLAADGPDDELKALSDTIDDLLHRLEAAFESQRRFVANASHELRTPLTVQRALVEVAVADPAAGVDELRDVCRQVVGNVEGQERLVDALLVLARSQRGVDRRVPVDLGAVVRTQIENRADDITAHGLRITTRLDPAPSTGDPELLERMVSNLLDNAVRHNTAAGWIEVVTGTTTDGEAVLRVANGGEPIEPDQVASLLERFRRHHADGSQPSYGHGLDLSIVEAVVGAHGGRLTAQPTPGGGLTVEVDLTESARHTQNADEPSGRG